MFSLSGAFRGLAQLALGVVDSRSQCQGTTSYLEESGVASLLLEDAHSGLRLLDETATEQLARCVEAQLECRAFPCGTSPARDAVGEGTRLHRTQKVTPQAAYLRVDLRECNEEVNRPYANDRIASKLTHLFCQVKHAQLAQQRGAASASECPQGQSGFA